MCTMISTVTTAWMPLLFIFAFYKYKIKHAFFSMKL